MKKNLTSQSKELKESREQYLRNKRQEPVPPRVTNAEIIYVPEDTPTTSDTGEETPPPQRLHLNLQRNVVNTTVATVPVILNTIFEGGIIDTGATNTMILQSAARQIGMIDHI